MTTTVAGYRQIADNIPSAIDRIAQQADVRRVADRYMQAIGTVRSVEDFLAKPDVYRFAMRAFGLEDMIYATAFVRRVLTEGIDRPDSLANKLTDRRFKDLAETFNFARYGDATVAFSRTQQGVVDRYHRHVLEENAGNSNQGVRLALYFHRSAGTISSPYQLLADRALLKVTQVALGLPEATSRIDIDRQADLIAKRLNVADLKDPAKVDKFLTRFTALWDLDNPQQLSLPSLVAPSSGIGPIGIGVDLLGQLQKIRPRG